MKTILFGILLLTFCANAQRSEVTLKNGSVILGKTKIVNDSIVKVTTKDGSIWQYSKNDITSIERYDYMTSNGKIYSTISLGYMPGVNTGNSLHIINGYRFNNHWNLGIGVGKESIEYNDYIPLFLYGQYNLFESSTTPFLSLMAGYEMPLNNNAFNRGGFTTGAQIGINHYFSKHIGLTTSVGYRFGYFENEQSNWNPQGIWWPEPVITIRELNRFEFRFGLVFK